MKRLDKKEKFTESPSLNTRVYIKINMKKKRKKKQSKKKRNTITSTTSIITTIYTNDTISSNTIGRERNRQTHKQANRRYEGESDR